MPVKVLINVHGNLPEDARPVVGNGLRARQLGAGLQAHGVEVTYACHGSFYRGVAPPAGLRTFEDSVGFVRLLQSEAYTLAICIQGEGLEHLPETGFDVPVLADWIAPRALEFSYQGLPLEQWLPRLAANVRKADYHACCTDAQRAFLYSLMQLAGSPLDAGTALVIPLSAPDDLPARPTRAEEPFFVAGGVHWPWIRSERFLRILLEEMDRCGRGTLAIFGGAYPFQTDSSAYRPPAESLPASPRLRVCGMLPYSALLREYRAADVAVNLFEENPERQLAFSFREIDYLRAGLPMVCAGFSHVSRFVRADGAGWVLDDLSDESVRRCFRELLALPAIPDSFGEAARDILRRHFDPARTIEPLLRVLSVPPRKSSPVAGLLQSSLLWADHARAELERDGAELRAARLELDQRARALEGYRRMDEEKQRNLVSAQATIDELRSYIAAKEKSLSDVMAAFAAKDEAIGYQKARLEATEGEILRLKSDLERLLEEQRLQLELLNADYEARIARLEAEKAGVEAALHSIQSKLLYRIYRKVTGK